MALAKYYEDIMERLLESSEFAERHYPQDMQNHFSGEAWEKFVRSFHTAISKSKAERKKLAQVIQFLREHRSGYLLNNDDTRELVIRISELEECLLEKDKLAKQLKFQYDATVNELRILKKRIGANPDKSLLQDLKRMQKDEKSVATVKKLKQEKEELMSKIQVLNGQLEEMKVRLDFFDEMSLEEQYRTYLKKFKR